MKIIDRIIEYQQFRKLNKKQFEETVGLSNGYLNTTLKRNSFVCQDVILKIVQFDPNISLKWLILNKGSMFGNDYEEIDNSLSEVAETPPGFLFYTLHICESVFYIFSQSKIVENAYKSSNGFFAVLAWVAGQMSL